MSEKILLDGKLISKTSYYRKIKRSKLLNCNTSEVPNYRGKVGNKAKGKDHYRWNGDELKTSHGYILVRVPKDHPMHNSNGYAYKHRLVMSEFLGRTLFKNEIVHHIDGNKSNNSICNLEITTKSNHNKHHNKVDKSRDASNGRFVKKV